MFRFAAPQMLVAYGLVPVILTVFAWSRARRRRDLARLGAPRLVERLTASVSHRGRMAKAVLLVGAVALLATALARPQFGSRVETVRLEGQDIAIALDLSASMTAEDIAPSRLARAKLAIRELLNGLQGDRVALIAFAGEAFVQCPLTLDYDAAILFLNAMDTETISVQGTNLGRAIEAALGVFGETDRRHRIVVLMTDGEDHEGGVDRALQPAIEDGVRIYTVGVGSTEGVPIPARNGDNQAQGYTRDDTGAVVTTRLGEATLQTVASRTGAAYYRVSPTGSNLDGLAEELTAGEGQEFETEQVTVFDEQYQLFLGLALVLLATELIVSERRRMKTHFVRHIDEA